MSWTRSWRNLKLTNSRRWLSTSVALLRPTASEVNLLYEKKKEETLSKELLLSHLLLCKCTRKCIIMMIIYTMNSYLNN